MTEYITEKTIQGVPLVRKNVEEKEVLFGVGLSAADSENRERPRDRRRFVTEYLNPMIEQGKIGDGVKSKFDDRKFRFSSASLEDDCLILRLGITHYKECADCRKWGEEKRDVMESKGLSDFADRAAYFTRGCGVAVTPITADGTIFLGTREIKEEASGFGGELSAINGWVEYRTELADVNFKRDALREAKEEYGIEKGDFKRVILAGVFSAPQRADADFAYLAFTSLPDKFFASGEYKQRRTEKEHGELIRVASYRDMQELLETGKLPGHDSQFKVLYSLRASLEQIKENEMA